MPNPFEFMAEVREIKEYLPMVLEQISIRLDAIEKKLSAIENRANPNLCDKEGCTVYHSHNNIIYTDHTFQTNQVDWYGDGK